MRIEIIFVVLIFTQLTNQILKLNPELVITSDGSHTIYVPELNEHYHSIYGAVRESTDVFIKNGNEFSKADPLNIFEVGFGTGLNTLLTAMRSINDNRKVNYTAIEKYPLSENVISTLNHFIFAGENGKELFRSIHSSGWGTFEEITKIFLMKKLKFDLITDTIEDKFDLIYFDAFGPDKQPEMWTRDIFNKISEMTVRNGVLVTYSAKGEVKRLLRSSGFEVFLLPGPPGKRQMIRAIKH